MNELDELEKLAYGLDICAEWVGYNPDGRLEVVWDENRYKFYASPQEAIVDLRCKIRVKNEALKCLPQNEHVKCSTFRNQLLLIGFQQS